MPKPSVSDHPDMSHYRADLRTMLLAQDPHSYRVFLDRWRDLHQRGIADRLIAMPDDALRVRLARMGLADPTLAVVHEVCTATLLAVGEEVSIGHADPNPASAPRRPRGLHFGSIRIRRPSRGGSSGQSA